MPPLKLPDFWEAHPAAWFLHIESLFALRGVVDDGIMYHHVVAALPPAATARLVGLLSAPPPTGKFPAIKTGLLYAFGLSDSERADRLFALNGLGGRKPSEMMAHILDLVGGRGPEFLLKQLFLRQLPSGVRAALANCTTADFVGFAAEADKYFLESRAAGAGAAHPLHASPSAKVKGSSNPPGSATQRQVQQSDLCYYHERFGPRATKCRHPCSFETQGNATAGARR